jgi:Biopolymer transport protein
VNFGADDSGDELEINLIPLIDVLLVILIFLAATTSFMRQTALEVALPQADAQAVASASLELAISREGRYALAGKLLDDATPEGLAAALSAAAAGRSEPVLVINADAQATHQSVVTAMQAARLAGIARVDFAAQTAR